MVSIILTYRNRDLNIVKNCLESFAIQNNKIFDVVLVDYGSVSKYYNDLIQLLENYSFVTLIHCKTELQLWCKSRAINIALKTIETSYCFVGDIDMLYHPEFINVLEEEVNKTKTTYFQVGFLSETESKKEKEFKDYNVAFKSSKDATGMTLYNTNLLKSINGYDEFYNGWGSEDTDVHMRLQNAGHQVNFYAKQLLMLHQWHPKNYRSKNDVTPFHSTLEQVNTAYLDLVPITKKIKANTANNWGIYNQENYSKLEIVDTNYNLTNKIGELAAFINGVLLIKKDHVITLLITEHKEYKSAKQKTKALLGKKTLVFESMQSINDSLLEAIIRNLRNQAYQYQFNRNTNSITLTIKL
ncbi:glycosyltransferase family 2 protein [Lacinutrix mariniflava]|uniref:glycosyltransferase family 2 protein n=1 Tax=Lacinutrix mariniflava TaxID=342955 RepID=UPI0006E286B2|nr:galactosyltransferase-related protein [Lacinutrix mariniflava]